MKNFVQQGNVLTMIAGAGGAVAGLVYVQGDIFGVAATSAAEGEEYELQVGEVFDLPKVSAQAWTQGVAIYWDATNLLATTTASTHKKIGVAVIAAANPSGLGRVRLNPSF